MLKINELYSILNEIAPFDLSQMCIDRGDYDNSGIIINSHEEINKVFFTLELSLESVEKARKVKADTIITHHPAIYQPIKSLSVDCTSTAPILKAVEYRMNVISLHLNLDVAKGGIDHCLANCLGGENQVILDKLTENDGYGRVFEIEEISFGDFVKKAKKNLQTERVVCYGNLKEKVKKISSFCGSGSSVAIGYFNKGTGVSDVIVTSDMPHHLIKEFVEKGVKILLLPHYTAENYGFKIFYENTRLKLKNTQTVYFEDKRFV